MLIIDFIQLIALGKVGNERMDGRTNGTNGLNGSANPIIRIYMKEMEELDKKSIYN